MGFSIGDFLDPGHVFHGDGGGPAPATPPPPAVDYSAAMEVESNNGKTVALAQIQSQEFALQQSSLDREMQNAAQLEQSLANFDTKLQISKLDYLQGMKAESDRHLEKVAEISANATQFGRMTASSESSVPDLPPPENA